MINPTTISEKLMFSTTRVEALLSSGQISSGSGCLVNIAAGANRVPLLVTNKHVIQGSTANKIWIHRVNSASGSAIPTPSTTSIEINLPGESEWISHPDDAVDLCAFPVGHIINECEKNGNALYVNPFPAEQFATPLALDELNMVEEVTMVGYPNGLWDATNNLPLFRRGVTASHPAIDFNGKSEFVVDIACFPGSSGSPVFLNPEESVMTTKQGNITVGSPRIFLLGMLYAGPQINAQGSITVQFVPTTTPTTTTPVMMHLGYVIKAIEIKKLCDHAIKIFKSKGLL
jgi:V8-like Glu-specific endopeptidase